MAAACTPWIIVCVVLLVWGSDWFKVPMNKIFIWNYPVEGLHNLISKVPPVVAKPTTEGAVFAFTWLTYTGSGMLIAAILSAFVMGFSPGRLVAAYGETIWALRYSLITIAAMLAIGTLTRYSGIDATLGLAFAHAGFLYPVLRHPARLAGRGADRLGHRVERAVRRPAEDHRRAARPVARS